MGKRGLKLSGGEKQRVALARTFLKSPRILLCDEATSALDSATDSDIMGELHSLAQGRTAIFVAHRLSTAMQCDQIVVMDGGRAVEVGTHDELLARGAPNSRCGRPCGRALTTRTVPPRRRQRPHSRRFPSAREPAPWALLQDQLGVQQKPDHLVVLAAILLYVARAAGVGGGSVLGRGEGGGGGESENS